MIRMSQFLLKWLAVQQIKTSKGHHSKSKSSRPSSIRIETSNKGPITSLQMSRVYFRAVVTVMRLTVVMKTMALTTSL